MSYFPLCNPPPKYYCKTSLCYKRKLEIWEMFVLERFQQLVYGKRIGEHEKVTAKTLPKRTRYKEWRRMKGKRMTIYGLWLGLNFDHSIQTLSNQTRILLFVFNVHILTAFESFWINCPNNSRHTNELGTLKEIWKVTFLLNQSEVLAFYLLI